MPFYRRAKQHRVEAKLSQNQLARKAEIDRATVSKVENGLLDVTDIKIRAMIDALNDAWYHAKGMTLKHEDEITES
jgi:predicted transcriptional regulator